MSVKAVITPYPVITNGDMSGTLTSLATDVLSCDNIAYQVVYTGSPVGDFAIEGTVNGTNWEPLDLGNPSPEASGSSGSFVVSLKGIPYAKLRLVYTATSGTGNLSVWVMGKRQGG